MHVTGQADGPPTKVGVSIVDIMTGMYASNAIQAALIRRSRTGEGAFIDCALLDSVTAILGFQAMNLMIADTEGRRLGNKHPNVVPYDVYRASDGDFIIASANEPQFRRLVTALGRPEMASDARFVRMGDRAKNRVALDEALNALTSEAHACREHHAARRRRCAGRPDQHGAGSVRRPAGEASRHAHRPEESARQIRYDARRSFGDHHGRHAGRVAASRAGAWRAYGRGAG